MTASVMKPMHITLSRMGVSAAFAVFVAVSFALSATAQETRITAVDFERILCGSQPARAARVKLEIESAKRDRELQDMIARLKGMSDKLDKGSAVLAGSDRNHRQCGLSDLDHDFQRKQREFREGLNQRHNEELAQVLERANRAIRSIAEQRKRGLIAQEVVHMNPYIDITDEVLKALNSQSAK